MKKILKEFRVEIIALLVALLGVFLLVERLEIRASVIRFLQTLFTQLRVGQERILTYITSFTVSDFIGWILILLTSAFVVWRARYRFLTSRFWRIEDCPRCGNTLHRIHRTRFDRFLTWILLPHSRRYRCNNDECHWSGLRHRIHRSHQTHKPTLDEPA
jgi:signal transduction histidine kinase